MESISRQQKSFYILFGAILCAHALFMASKIQSEYSSSDWDRPGPIKIKLVPDAMRTAALAARQQIVQSEDSATSEKKPNAFLSDKDRSFDRQTIARNTDTFKQAGAGNAAVTQKAQPKTAEQSNKKAKTDLKNLKLSDFGMAAGEMTPQVARSPASESRAGTRNGNPSTDGLSATNDYVEEVALGDFTHLNTVEYKFYGFFHRIRQKLEQFWGKSIREKADALYRSGRRLPASDNLVTNIQVTLDEKGEITAVKILSPSGVRELDDAAVESFNQAGPFPNPPKELLVNGKATIDWGFVVKS